MPSSVGWIFRGVAERAGGVRERLQLRRNAQISLLQDKIPARGAGRGGAVLVPHQGQLCPPCAESPPTTDPAQLLQKLLKG